MSQALIDHLSKHHGLPAALATKENAEAFGKSLVTDGKLSITDYTDLVDGKAVAVVAEKATPIQPQGQEGINRVPDSAVQPAEALAGAMNPKAGTVNVRRASASYDGTKARKVYPNDAKFAKHFASRAGRDMTFEGRAAYDSSDLEKAYAGAYFKHRFATLTNSRHLLNDHDKDLYAECLEKCDWVGEVPDPSAERGMAYLAQPKQLSGLQQKTLLEDSTSGGISAVPYFFDVDLVTFPLLYGELFPLVDVRELGISNQVITPTLQNMTVSSGPLEGDSPTISLQATANLMTKLTTNVYNATGAITIGRDFLSDSPIDVQADVQQLYQKSLLQWLDNAIANGDGTTTPLGLANVAGPIGYTSKNNTAGPITVSDVEGMIKSLPKQYRNKQENVIFAASDALYFRIRGMSVSSTDQRRIFGYDYQDYMLASHPFKVQNSIPGSTLFFANMAKYRMWRRKGMTMEVSTEGRTNLMANEMLIVMRSRWAGNWIDPNGLVACTNASLH